MQYSLQMEGIHAMMLTNSHIEQPAPRVNARLSTTHKQGAAAARAITGRTLLVDTNVITTNTIILTERERERERQRERERLQLYTIKRIACTQTQNTCT